MRLILETWRYFHFSCNSWQSKFPGNRRQCSDQIKHAIKIKHVCVISWDFYTAYWQKLLPGIWNPWWKLNTNLNWKKNALPEVDKYSLKFNLFWTSDDVIWCYQDQSSLAQVMTCCLMAPSHYVNQCWLISNETMSKWNFYDNTNNLTHWGRVTHICISKLTIIGSDNGLSPGRCQAIIWTNDGILILLIGPMVTSFNEILI